MHINLQEEEEKIEIEYLKYVRMVDCSCESYYIGCDDGKFDDSSEHVAEFSLLEDNNGLSVTGNSWCPRRALHPGLYQQLRGGEGFLELHEFNNVDYVMAMVTVEIAENLNYRWEESVL